MSSSEKSDTELLVPPQVIGKLSDYERQRQERIERNNARLDKLGFGSEPKEAKKVIEKRKSPPVDEPRRVLPSRKQKSVSYNVDEYFKDIE